jgi:hypothetical protein
MVNQMRRMHFEPCGVVHAGAPTSSSTSVAVTQPPAGNEHQYTRQNTICKTNYSKTSATAGQVMASTGVRHVIVGISRRSY